MPRHEHLPKELKHLAWLSLDDADGQEYWAAMNLMGRYAAANHALIHKHIAKKLGAHVILDIENHHNFAWKETHVVNGEAREVIVHRKGATPAGAGVLGVIPGSMASSAYVGPGKGDPRSLNSAPHGAGRREGAGCQGRHPAFRRPRRGAHGLQGHRGGHGRPDRLGGGGGPLRSEAG